LLGKGYNSNMRSHGGVIARLTELIGELPDDADPDTLIGLSRVISQAEAKFCRQIRSFDARQDYAATDPPANSTLAWLRHFCHLSGGDASAHVRVARTLPDLPDTRAAFDAGEIGFSHVDSLALLARQTSTEAVREVQGPLLELARAAEPGQLRKATGHVRHMLDPDGVLKDANRAREHRYLRASATFGGMVVLDGQLDPEAGAVVMTALDSMVGPTTPGDPRTRYQRQADALVEICRYRMDTGTLPTRGRQQPHLNVTVSLETLAGMPDSPAADLDFASIPVPAATAQRLACDPELTRIILGPDSEVLDVGRSRRLATAGQDRAVRQRDHHCRWETCDRPAHLCHLHHRIPWWAGGHTDFDNLLLLCEHHHRLVHEGKQPLRLREPEVALRI
jgi:Domain of unknown function (DUF222)/HNH endonuclease